MGDDIVISTLATNAPIQVDQGACLVNIIPITFCFEWHYLPPGSADLSPISGALMIIVRNYHQSQKMKYIKAADFPALQSLIEVMKKKGVLNGVDMSAS
ncbi:hypothetical protein M2418_004406 [Rhizobium sp. BIGb0125]|uniref:hypothetical protein n=1 Tax=Rhizobium sp. BIGb0125 TaxID=2940618 RepID=UPI0021684993|nr:hypothetical protein [Rhizobium sp. BIGb0125]MCS4244865.1 hypothetical protein [Rhizobium sp. BIGb0125]